MYVASATTRIVVKVVPYSVAHMLLHCAILLHVSSPNLNDADMNQ
jgi:hypothetical protein